VSARAVDNPIPDEVPVTIKTRTLICSARSSRCNPLSLTLRMNAKLVPVGLGKVHLVVVRSFLNVRECHNPVGIGDIDNLVKPRDRVAYVLSVGEGLFALLAESKDAVRQVAPSAEPTISS
jgi:hypothetical protein